MLQGSPCALASITLSSLALLPQGPELQVLRTQPRSAKPYKSRSTCPNNLLPAHRQSATPAEQDSQPATLPPSSTTPCSHLLLYRSLVVTSNEPGTALLHLRNMPTHAFGGIRRECSAPRANHNPQRCCCFPTDTDQHVGGILPNIAKFLCKEESDTSPQEEKKQISK